MNLLESERKGIESLKLEAERFGIRVKSVKTRKGLPGMVNIKYVTTATPDDPEPWVTVFAKIVLMSRKYRAVIIQEMVTTITDHRMEELERWRYGKAPKKLYKVRLKK